MASQHGYGQAPSGQGLMEDDVGRAPFRYAMIDRMCQLHAFRTQAVAQLATPRACQHTVGLVTGCTERAPAAPLRTVPPRRRPHVVSIKLDDLIDSVAAVCDCPATHQVCREQLEM